MRPPLLCPLRLPCSVWCRPAAPDRPGLDRQPGMHPFSGGCWPRFASPELQAVQLSLRAPALRPSHECCGCICGKISAGHCHAALPPQANKVLREVERLKMATAAPPAAAWAGTGVACPAAAAPLPMQQLSPAEAANMAAPSNGYPPLASQPPQAACTTPAAWAAAQQLQPGGSQGLQQQIAQPAAVMEWQAAAPSPSQVRRESSSRGKQDRHTNNMRWPNECVGALLCRIGRPCFRNPSRPHSSSSRL